MEACYLLFANILLKLLNKGAVPVIESAWTYLAKNENYKAVKSI